MTRRLYSPAINPPRTVRVFLSYSHQDASDAQALLDYLSGLQKEGFKFWWDRRLSTGDVWDATIKAELEQADIALVLVSQPFLNSEYASSVEMARLIERRKAGGLRLYPVLVSPCDWKNIEWLKQTQIVPREGKTLRTDYKDAGARDALFLTILQELRQIGQSLPSTEPPPPEGTRVRQAISDEAMFKAIGSGDPVEANPAIEALAERIASRPELCIAALKGLSQSVTIDVFLRRAFASAASASGAALVGHANRSDIPYWERSRAVQLLTPAHREEFAGFLGEGIEPYSVAVDDIQIKIMGLGYLGAGSWASILNSVIAATDSDGVRKWAVLVTQSILRMFVLATSVDPCQDTSAAFFKAHSRAPTPVWPALDGSRAPQCEALLTSWLESKNESLQLAAINTLGYLRFRRAARPLLSLWQEGAVGLRSAAAAAVGRIGIPEFLEVLRAHRDTPEARNGLLEGLEFLEDRTLAEELISAELSKPDPHLNALRAAGLLGLNGSSARLETVLRDAKDKYTRARAALALARIEGTAKLHVLEQALAEASDEYEMLWARLAVMYAAPDRADEHLPMLRHLLSYSVGSLHLWMSEPRYLKGIFDVLDAIGSDATRAVADAWRPLLAEGVLARGI